MSGQLTVKQNKGYTVKLQHSSMDPYAEEEAYWRSVSHKPRRRRHYRSLRRRDPPRTTTLITSTDDVLENFWWHMAMVCGFIIVSNYKNL
jgi:hypothetical protein